MQRVSAQVAQAHYERTGTWPLLYDQYWVTTDSIYKGLYGNETILF